MPEFYGDFPAYYVVLQVERKIKNLTAKLVIPI